METSISGPILAVLNAQNDRRGLGPIETINSDPKVSVCFQKPQMRDGTMETSNSDANHFVLNAKNHR